MTDDNEYQDHERPSRMKRVSRDPRDGHMDRRGRLHRSQGVGRVIPAEQAREIRCALREIAAEAAMRKPPPPFPPGSGGMSSRSRMTLRTTHVVLARLSPGDSELFARPGETRVIRSGDPGPLIHRSAADRARFRALGYWDGFGVEFPPCQCVRCRTSKP